MIVGLAGHIDHGKTTLVKAITGVDTDRLPQEKARGMTIELGFAYWPQADGRVIGFVDAPGHERFVHTMIAGAQGVDLVLLTIAADDGVMPQTREHLDIISLLDAKSCAVALTKIDAVPPERIHAVRADIAAFLAPGKFADSPIFPLSAQTGLGLEALKSWLTASHAKAGQRDATRVFRLAVDRVFLLTGIGLIVTGAVLDGEIHTGDEVIVSPSRLTARIRKIHAQNQPADCARAGDRCALNLVGSDISKDKIFRGDMIVAPSAHAPTRRIDADLLLAPGAKNGLKQWAPVRLHHGTADLGGHIVLLSDDAIQPGEALRVQIVLEKPIAALALDRFILRDPSASTTLGGGRFLDLRAPTRKRRTLERTAILDALAQEDDFAGLASLLECSSGGVDIDVFARDRGLALAQVQTWLTAQSAVVLAQKTHRFALSRRRASVILSDVCALLAKFHADHPDLTGMGLERLRMQSAPKLAAALFRALLRVSTERGAQALPESEAFENSLVVDGHWIRLASHSTALSPADKAVFDALLPYLSGPARFKPPRVRDIAQTTQRDESAIRRLLRHAARAGALDEIATDHFFLRSAVAELVDHMETLERESGGWFNASAFRDCLENDGVTQIGRKVAIQILEFFDSHGLTIRRGDMRRINPHRRRLFSRDIADDI